MPVRAAGRLAGPAVPLAALCLAFGLSGVGVVWSLTLGQGDVPVSAVLSALVDYDPMEADHVIVREIRLPRTVLAVLVGAALAVAGALIQVLTRNPLAEPGVLGVTFGASFAIVLTTWLGVAGGQPQQMGIATAGAAVATAIVYGVGRVEPLRLVLAGMALSALLMGLSVGIRLIDTDAFDLYRFWSVGSLAGRDQQPLGLPIAAIVVALGVTLLLIRPLAAIQLGDDVAHGLGVPVGVTRTATLLVATVLAGVATAFAGPIAFAGLIVPHLARRFAQGSVGWLLLLSMVLGPALLVAADTIGRLLLPTGDTPVAIVTAFVGGPVLIWVVRRYGSGATR